MQAFLKTSQNLHQLTGTRVYLVHSVLYDWPDADCRRILQNIAAAMKVGYSKLLINENVIPDMGASWQITSLDWIMMGVAASRERTGAQWPELLQSAGLTVVVLGQRKRVLRVSLKLCWMIDP